MSWLTLEVGEPMTRIAARRMWHPRVVRVYAATAVVIALGAGAPSRADVAVRVVDPESPVLDGGVSRDHGGVGGAVVRIVGDTVVVIVRTNGYGQFSVGGLAPGVYRVETDGGHLFELAHLDGPLIEPQPGCDIWAPRRDFETVLGRATPAPAAPAPVRRPYTPPRRRGHVDTTSTARNTVITQDVLRSTP
jgi:hypothetical protein